MTCQCALPTGGTATVRNDVCDIIDPRMKPQTTRSCGLETRLLTAGDVIAGGGDAKLRSVIVIITCSKPSSVGLGEGSCIWRVAGPYGECSATCDGTQTREVFCQCTLNTTEEVGATGDNCEIDDLRFMPINTRSCGIECLPPGHWYTPTWRSTTQPPPIGTRMHGPGQSLHATDSVST